MEQNNMKCTGNIGAKQCGRLMRYSMQLIMLQKLLRYKLLSEREYIFEDNSSTGYNEVWTFVINFDEAEKYRKLRGGFLRKNQWRDLTVHVFV